MQYDSWFFGGFILIFCGFEDKKVIQIRSCFVSSLPWLIILDFWKKRKKQTAANCAESIKGDPHNSETALFSSFRRHHKNKMSLSF